MPMTPSPTLLAVRVTPRASRDEVAGWSGDELEVRVVAPPDGGKANAAVCSAVARAIGLPKSRVSVRRGSTSRHKVLEITGLDGEAVSAALRGSSRS
jgi:uncharacterized protein (TIGR00251 family)